MTSHSKLFTILAITLVILATVIVFWLFPNFSKIPGESSNQGYSIGFGDDTVKARVLDILEEGTTQLGNQTQPYQILLIKSTGGYI